MKGRDRAGKGGRVRKGRVKGRRWKKSEEKGQGRAGKGRGKEEQRREGKGKERSRVQLLPRHVGNQISYLHVDDSQIETK